MVVCDRNVNVIAPFIEAPGNRKAILLNPCLKKMKAMADKVGLKIYGAGEWEEAKHGKGRRKGWMKLHLQLIAGF